MFNGKSMRFVQATFCERVPPLYAGEKSLKVFSDGMILFVTRDKDQHEKVMAACEFAHSSFSVDAAISKVSEKVGIKPHLIFNEEKMVETGRDFGDFPEGEKKDGHT